jgi:hypothetical protein
MENDDCGDAVVAIIDASGKWLAAVSAGLLLWLEAVAETEGDA